MQTAPGAAFNILLPAQVPKHFWDAPVNNKMQHTSFHLYHAGFQTTAQSQSGECYSQHFPKTFIDVIDKQ